MAELQLQSVNYPFVFAPARLPHSYKVLGSLSSSPIPPLPCLSSHATLCSFPAITSTMVCIPPFAHMQQRSLTWKQNALFNSALRQSTALRKDLDLFADSSSPNVALQGQISASLTSFSRTIDDYGKLAKQEPIQTKQEKAFERIKNFRGELDEYRESFQRIKSANEDVVCLLCLFSHRTSGAQMD